LISDCNGIDITGTNPSNGLIGTVGDPQMYYVGGVWLCVVLVGLLICQMILPHSKHGVKMKPRMTDIFKQKPEPRYRK
jgi:hypothetical protein